MANISREARLEIVHAVAERYQASSKGDKTWPDPLERIQV